VHIYFVVFILLSLAVGTLSVCRRLSFILSDSRCAYFYRWWSSFDGTHLCYVFTLCECFLFADYITFLVRLLFLLARFIS